MTLQEMNVAELQETNGGFIFGRNNNGSGGLGLGLGLDNLLSFETKSSDSRRGEESWTSFSLLNGLSLGLEGMFSSR